MSTNDQMVSANQVWWEKMVAEGNGFTRPWLHLDPAVVRAYAEGHLDRPPRPLDQMFPARVLAGIQSKDVLCLASGGGQQSAVFGILGARVTVFDMTAGQLAADKEAAATYGYTVTTIQGDMRDLAALQDASFDLVYQAPSMAYVPDVKQVYAEVARVLRPGGVYRADAHNPLAQFVEDSSWDGTGYRISVPYAVKAQQRAKDEIVFEFRHDLSDIFNGLILYGFVIEQVLEAPSDLYQEGAAEPGMWPHSELYLSGLFAIVARKNQKEIDGLTR